MERFINSYNIRKKIELKHISLNEKIGLKYAS